MLLFGAGSWLRCAGLFLAFISGGHSFHIYIESVGHLHSTHNPSSEFANLDYIVCEPIAAM